MKLATALCVLAAVSALAAPPADAAVKVRYYKGQPAYVSGKAGGVVQLVMPAPSKDRRVGVMVVALNRRGYSQTLGYENVAIRTTAGAPVKLLSFEELEHKAKVRARWATVLVAAVGGVSSYAAQQSAHGTVRGKVSTTTPYGRINSTYSARTYNRAAAQFGQAAALVETHALMSSVSNSLDATLARLDDSVLRTTTIDPYQSFGGLVVFDLPKGATLQDLIATVRFAGEVHDISLAGVAGPLDQGPEVESDAPSSPTPATTPLAAPSPSGRSESQRIAYETNLRPIPAARAEAVACKNYLIWMPSDPSKSVCAD